jgi:hypothetical protein
MELAWEKCGKLGNPFFPLSGPEKKLRVYLNNYIIIQGSSPRFF